MFTRGRKYILLVIIIPHSWRVVDYSVDHEGDTTTSYESEEGCTVSRFIYTFQEDDGVMSEVMRVRMNTVEVKGNGELLVVGVMVREQKKENTPYKTVIFFDFMVGLPTGLLNVCFEYYEDF